jgi:hypothetical protein
MNVEVYTVTSDAQHKRFEFLSEGPQGTIKKIVQYQHLGNNIFNLAFGDWDEELQDMVDNVRSNNHDRDKVLATVAYTVTSFIQHHPNATICAKGNTAAKTRLYQIGINSNWYSISKLFVVEGYIDGAWERFDRQKNYEAFALFEK